MTEILVNLMKGMLYAYEIGLAVSVACLALIVVCSSRQNNKNKEDK